PDSCAAAGLPATPPPQLGPLPLHDALPILQPRGQVSATAARSGNPRRMLSGFTCPRPNDRTPGVSMIHPPVGTRSETVEDEVCRPRPVTAFTTPVARSVPGTSALTSVDFPTPECPTATVV